MTILGQGYRGQGRNKVLLYSPTWLCLNRESACVGKAGATPLILPHDDVARLGADREKTLKSVPAISASRECVWRTGGHQLLSESQFLLWLKL